MGENMNQVYIQNLAMIVTDNCNLNCAHCMRGKSCNNNMSKEVIKATLSQTKAIGNLNLCGGEPTLALDTIEEIFKYIIHNRTSLPCMRFSSHQHTFPHPGPVKNPYRAFLCPNLVALQAIHKPN